MNVALLQLDQELLLSELMDAIKQGVLAAGETPVHVTELNQASTFRLAVLGFSVKKTFFSHQVSDALSRALKHEFGVPLAVCALSSQSAKADVANIIQVLGERNRIVNTLHIKTQSHLFSRKITETDLIRAKGFGERVTNIVNNVSVRHESEKQRIRKYLK